MSSLALCMIVKNEQQFLPYCLASVYKYCDEIIVVDTGSTDRTIEIAESFGAYIIRAKLNDNFSLVRNIAQSPSKSDWILWLDGDEVLSDNGIKKIKTQLIEDPTADFFLLPRVNFWKNLQYCFAYPDSQYKLYRNNIGLKWTGKLHEKIYDDNNIQHRRRLKHCDVHTFHYAYVKDKEEVKKKMQLYIHIENPDMDLKKIERCSTEHSFFYDRNPPEVQDYNGSYPEIFNRLEITLNEIKFNDGSKTIEFLNQKPEKKEIETFKQGIPDLLSIVIATYNKLEYLDPLIKGIYQSTHIDFELIIVDNGSTEQNIIDYLITSEKEYKNFRFIHLNENMGFAKGYNAGIKESKGEWICVLNNDTLVTDGAFDKMITYLKADPELAIIAPVSNNIHGEHQMLPTPEVYSFGAYIDLVNRLSQQTDKKVAYSSWITACCWIFHRDLIEQLAKIPSPPKVGYFFDESFLIGQSEDSDLCFSVAHRLHKKLGVAKDCLLWHHGSKTLNDLGINVQELQQKNNEILRKKWPDIFK